MCLTIANPYLVSGNYACNNSKPQGLEEHFKRDLLNTERRPQRANGTRDAIWCVHHSFRREAECSMTAPVACNHEVPSVTHHWARPGPCPAFILTVFYNSSIRTCLCQAIVSSWCVPSEQSRPAPMNATQEHLINQQSMHTYEHPVTIGLLSNTGVVRSISEISSWFFCAETLAHWNPTSCQKNIHN